MQLNFYFKFQNEQISPEVFHQQGLRSWWILYIDSCFSNRYVHLKFLLPRKETYVYVVPNSRILRRYYYIEIICSSGSRYNLVYFYTIPFHASDRDERFHRSGDNILRLRDGAQRLHLAAGENERGQRTDVTAARTIDSAFQHDPQQHSKSDRKLDCEHAEHSDNESD